MRNVFSLEAVGFSRWNVTEYTYFSKKVAELIQATSVESLHLTAEKLALYEAGVTKLEDLVAQSRVYDETEKIAEQEKAVNALSIYLLDDFRKSALVPITSIQEAAKTLRNATSSYKGMYRLPQLQLLQKARGLLKDLGKEELAPHVVTLGLSDVVAELSAATARLSILIDQRSNKQLENATEAAKGIRKELDALFTEMMTIVFAYSVVEPADAITGFMASINKLVSDVMTAYKKRTAQSDKTEEEETTEETPSTEEEETPEASVS